MDFILEIYIKNTRFKTKSIKDGRTLMLNFEGEIPGLVSEYTEIPEMVSEFNCGINLRLPEQCLHYLSD